MCKKLQSKIFSFDLQFRGSKRTAFYRKLFGFSSKVKKEDSSGETRVYENFYSGLLTSIPHLKLGKSVIAVPKEAAGELREFFNDSEWGSIRLHVFSGLLSSEERMKAMMETLERIRLNNQTLKSEIESLRKIISRNQFDSEDIPRAKGVVRAINSLIDLDWTDNNEFSKSIQKEIKPIKGAISEF